MDCVSISPESFNALALLWSLSLDWNERLASVMEFSEAERALLHIQLEKKINTPLTSSMGCLFDAIAALADVRQMVNYEWQAAIKFESLADSAEAESYSFALNQARSR
jgi:hydrogenase maturation protein HypF